MDCDTSNVTDRWRRPTFCSKVWVLCTFGLLFGELSWTRNCLLAPLLLGVKASLQMAISGPNDGIMIPVPQYPLYSASVALLGGKSIGCVSWWWFSRHAIFTEWSTFGPPVTRVAFHKHVWSAFHGSWGWGVRGKRASWVPLRISTDSENCKGPRKARDTASRSDVHCFYKHRSSKYLLNRCRLLTRRFSSWFSREYTLMIAVLCLVSAIALELRERP